MSFSLRPVAGEPDARPGEDAEAFAARCAWSKLEGAAPAAREVVVAADTVVALEGRIMGKPADSREALDMLLALAGRDHQVITAVALALPGGERLRARDVCHVHFHPWSREVLAAYAATGECLDKAGAYAIQGKGAFLAERIEGSWSTVVGLPVTWLARTLTERGILLPAGDGTGTER